MTPPLINGAFFVDNSTMELITTCPRAAEYYTINRRELNTEHAAFRFGTHIHHALAMHHTGFSEEIVTQRLIDNFAVNPCDSEGWRNLNSALLTLKSYFRHKHLHPWKPRNVWKTVREIQDPLLGFRLHRMSAVELTFAAFIGRVRGIPIIYTGRIDLLVELSDGLFVVDHKTTSVLGDSWWWDQAISPQYLGYCWAVVECYGIEPTGYLVNALGIRPSIANASWDDIEEKIIVPKGSKAVPVEFARQKFYTKVPRGQLEEWRVNLLAQVRTYFDYCERGYFPMHRKACVGKYGRCPYYNVDELPAASREVALASPAFRNVTWSPLRIT